MLAATEGLWEDLRGGALFVTGGTGFFGCWMLETFVRANDELGLDAHAVVLSRDPARFHHTAPHLAGHHAVRLVAGDLLAAPLPAAACTHILHMGTETNTLLTQPRATAYFDTSVKGTQSVLDLARQARCRKLLLTSSGAVYGPQPPDRARLDEDYLGAPRPEDTSEAYAHGKRAAEFLCAAAHEEWGLEAKIARCFAFVGPYMDLDSGFALGNFIRDALFGDRLRVTGDGTPRRSYLYASDLAVWLWTILFDAAPARPYNVGSEQDMSIRELAETVAAVVGRATPVDVAKTPAAGAAVKRYVPDTSRAAAELGLRASVGLHESIARTASWFAAAAVRNTPVS